MKMADGLIRGKQCGKQSSFAPTGYICALCLRYGNDAADLCFPERIAGLKASSSRE